jgi:hypothetical protein
MQTKGNNKLVFYDLHPNMLLELTYLVDCSGKDQWNALYESSILQAPCNKATDIAGQGVFAIVPIELLK